MSNLMNHELEHSKKFRMTIIEILKQVVEVEADDPHEAEQMVSDGWQSSKYILGSEDFIDAEFEVALVSNTLG